jgi:hypothetical protein
MNGPLILAIDGAERVPLTEKRFEEAFKEVCLHLTQRQIYYPDYDRYFNEHSARTHGKDLLTRSKRYFRIHL